MGALASAVQSGKAIYVGLSNYDGETLKKAATILKELHCPFVINQNRYSIFDRTVEENGLMETTDELQKGLTWRRCSWFLLYFQDNGREKMLHNYRLIIFSMWLAISEITELGSLCNGSGSY